MCWPIPSSNGVARTPHLNPIDRRIRMYFDVRNERTQSVLTLGPQTESETMVDGDHQDMEPDRRRFIGAAARTIAASRLGLVGLASAPFMQAQRPRSMMNEAPPQTSFGPLKHVDAGVLNVGYAEEGPTNGPAVILLHGWPYDIHSYVDVAPLLAAKGYRVIVPYLRGYGTTRFLSSETFRNGQQSAVALDVIALMDALEIEKAIVAGFDWGARTADIVAALWPGRCKALVAVSGYLITNPKANLQPLPPKAELGWWYQYYFATERGERGYDENRREFNKLIWKIASPKWNFDDATFNRTAASFDNADHVGIVIHNYRWRLDLAKGEPRYDQLEQKLFMAPVITVPTITIGSDFDGAAADGASYSKKFSGKYSHRVFNGIGHNVPQEAPKAFAQAVIDVDGY
jgi:pimeloyl-ACP methyl ester carboxylesterase